MQVPLVLLFASSCTGIVSGGRAGSDVNGGGAGSGDAPLTGGHAETGGQGGDGGDGGGVFNPMSPEPYRFESGCDATVAQALPAAFQRLTVAEYQNSVRDLTGITPAQKFPGDEAIAGFAGGGNVTALRYELYRDTAEAVAEGMLSKTFADLAGADGVVQRAELLAFIPRIGRRFYRQPLAAAQIDRIAALYDEGAAAEDSKNGVRLLLQGMLQSPNFLYRIESGGPAVNGSKPLTGFERAARLSFLLRDTTPDDQLLDLAASGGLDSAAQVAAKAREMLGDVRAKPALASFVRQWLQLDVQSLSKDARIYPLFNPALQTAMAKETELFLDHALFAVGTFGELFTSRHSFVNRDLAGLYGIPPSGGTSFAPVDLPQTERAGGILSQAAFLSVQAHAEQSSPVKRGVFVRRSLLCQDLPEPPADVDNSAPPPDPQLSTRERFAAHRDTPSCQACHTFIDPVGFGFEHYDGIGQFRVTEGGAPVDAAGTIENLDGHDHPFDGLGELAQRLVHSEEAQRCVGTQLFRFSLQANEGPRSACALDAIQEQFAASGYDLQELVVALVSSEPFLNVQ